MSLSPDQTLKLARAELDPTLRQQYEPITRGPLFAILALAFWGLLAVPFVMVLIVKKLWRCLG